MLLQKYDKTQVIKEIENLDITKGMISGDIFTLMKNLFQA